MYCLRHKISGELIGYFTSSNADGSFCVDVQYILTEGAENNKLWSVKDKYQAEYVRKFSTEWYNAGYDSPTHYFKPDDLEVVEVEIIQKVTPVKVSIPTLKEYLEVAYKERDPGHYKSCMEQIDTLSPYNYYELSELINKKKWPKS